MFKKNRSVSLKLPEDLRKPFQAQQKHECNPFFFFFFVKRVSGSLDLFCLYLRPRRKLFRKPTWKVFVFPSPNGFVKSTPGSPWHSAGPGAGCEWTGPGARNWSFLGIYDIWVFSKIGVPQNGWFIMENSIKVGWFGGKTPIFGNIHIFLYKSLHNRQRFGAFSIFCWSTSQGVSVFTTWFKAAAATDWWKLVLEKKIMTGWAPKTHYLNMYILYEYFPNNLNPFNLTIHTVFFGPWDPVPSVVKLCQKIEVELRIWPRSCRVFNSQDGFFILHSGRQDVDAASGHNHVAGSFLKRGDCWWPHFK